MTKEDVVIESLNELEENVMVSVILYDTENKFLTGKVIEVLPRIDAYDKYNVVGEVISGETIMKDNLSDDGWSKEDYFGDFYDEDE